MARVTFRFTLTTIFLGVLLVAVSSVAAVSFYFSRKNAEDLSEQILDQTSERIRLHTESLVDTAIEQSKTLTILLETDFIDQDFISNDAITAASFRKLGGHFWNAMTVHDSLAFLSLAIPETGEYALVERWGDQLTIREYRQVDEVGRQIFEYDSFAPDRTPIDILPHNGYDPRERPFYKTATDAGTAAWTNTYGEPRKIEKNQKDRRYREKGWEARRAGKGKRRWPKDLGEPSDAERSSKLPETD